MQAPTSFLWYDYETFGTDPAADRPAQFAGLRTDGELRVQGESMNWYCAPADDVLPHPMACLITGITPQRARAEGTCEAHFAGRVHDALLEPGTCVAGYNNLRFDDVFSRNLFYRNFFDPYQHEYANGNTRWDLIDLVRMCYALRPDGIRWPLHESGSPSFRLEDLTRANGIAHEGAHDALADVRATIELARLIRRHQGPLFEWGLSLRDRSKAGGLIDPRRPEPVLHTSARIAAERGCTTLVLPIVAHPSNGKSVIVFDLMSDPEPLIGEPAERLHDRVFTPAADLPQDIERLPLKEVRTNGVPMLAPASTLRGVDCRRIRLEPERCQRHATRLLGHIEAVAAKVREVYGAPPPPASPDPDFQLYSGGFFSRRDRQAMDRVRQAQPGQLGTTDWPFQDPRLPEMLFRYRARNYPDTLSLEEADRWHRWRRQRLMQPQHEKLLGLADFRAALTEARQGHLGDGRAQAILDQLQAWAIELDLAIEDGDPGP